MELQYISECAKYGDARYQFAFGLLCWFGIGTVNQRKVAIDWVKRAAEQHCEQAAYALYFLLRAEDARDLVAIEWLQDSARAGFAPAQFRLGVNYEQGHEVEKSLDKAVEWIKKSSDQGYLPAMHHLASMYLEGISIKGDRARGQQLLLEAVQRGYPPSLYLMGMELVETRSDLKEGFRLIMLAAAKDHYASNLFLSNAYRTGRYGVPKDNSLAEMFRARAEQLQG
jgi:TPR repeat protein